MLLFTDSPEPTDPGRKSWLWWRAFTGMSTGSANVGWVRNSISSVIKLIWLKKRLKIFLSSRFTTRQTICVLNEITMKLPLAFWTQLTSEIFSTKSQSETDRSRLKNVSKYICVLQISQWFFQMHLLRKLRCNSLLNKIQGATKINSL